MALSGNAGLDPFRLAFEFGPNAQLLANGAGLIQMVNLAAERLFGYNPEELMGHPVEDLLPGCFRALYEGHWADFAADSKPRPMGTGRELFGVRKDGQQISVEVGLNLIETEDGPLVLAAIIDISTRKDSEQVWRRYAAIVESSDDAIVSKTMEGIITSWNPAAERMFGYSAAEAIGRPTTMLFPPDLLAEEAEFLRCIGRGERITRYETVRVRKDGSTLHVSVILSPILDRDGRIVGASKIAHDITELKRMSDKIKSLAFYDPLTHLPNRRLLLDRLKHALLSNRRNGKEGAVLLIDIDHFKTVNDTLGHDAGDSLLEQVARRLASAVREVDTVGRLGGDEFVVVLEDLCGEPAGAKAQVEQIYRAIAEKLKQPSTLASQEHFCTVSVGAALFGKRETNETEILKQADIAMYAAKAGGRNTLRLAEL
jgi:diguanylate cyclase (GGDEF)-like protein/PAS domain S-box-containing protein